MTQFSSEFKKELLAFLKENLTFEVVESTQIVDRSYGDYCEKTNFTIKLLVGGETIHEENLSYYNQS